VLSLPCLGKDPEATFGQRLKAHRLAAGMTLERLGELTAINAHTLGDYEQGWKLPHWLNVERLIRFLGVSLVDLKNKLAGGPRVRALPPIGRASRWPHGSPARLPFAASTLTSPATITAR
jgi:transcriptional regulator with XRE-family HTH domain